MAPGSPMYETRTAAGSNYSSVITKCQKIKWSHKAVSMPTIFQHTLLSQLTLPVEEHDLTGYVFHSIDGNDSIIGLCWE